MFGNPVLGPRIVPFGQPRLQTDRLPNGHPGFRVTQRFGDPDAFFPGQIHGALDLGNYYEGDAVVAMEDGVVVPLADPNGALGQEVQHDNGYRTQSWHLKRRVDLLGMRINRGRTIGYVGKTGLTIAGAHLHLAVYDPDGQLVDPWPLLDQNKPVIPPGTPWKAIMYSIGRPFIRLTPGGKIIGTAKVNQRFNSLRIVQGPGYADQRNGKMRFDWVIIQYAGNTASIAKSFLKTVPGSVQS